MFFGPFRSSRLTLREYEVSVFVNSHALASDPEVVKYVTFGTNDEKASRDFVAQSSTAHQNDERRTIRFVVDLPGVGLIGDIVLIQGREQDRGAELGYYLRRDYWGRGYAPEAARTMIDLGESVHQRQVGGLAVLLGPSSRVGNRPG